jgi:hypothetical protein
VRVRAIAKVRLDFANGVSIERFRSYSSKGGNGVQVLVNGKVNEFMEKGVAPRACVTCCCCDLDSRIHDGCPVGLSGDGSRSSQDAIEEMLGIDFDTFARTVVVIISLLCCILTVALTHASMLGCAGQRHHAELHFVDRGAAKRHY